MVGTTTLFCRYAQLCAEVENCVANSRFVLQWMLHARLREARGEAGDCDGEGSDSEGESSVERPDIGGLEASGGRRAVATASAEDAGSSAAAARHQIHTALNALQAATTMAAVVEAVGAAVRPSLVGPGVDGGREDPQTHASPPPHARRYIGDYFSRLDEHGDWAGVPPRRQYAAWHAADEDPIQHAIRTRAHRPTVARRPSVGKKRQHTHVEAEDEGAAGAADTPVVVALGVKRKKRRGARLSKSEREARRNARGGAEQEALAEIDCAQV